MVPKGLDHERRDRAVCNLFNVAAQQVMKMHDLPGEYREPLLSTEGLRV